MLLRPHRHQAILRFLDHFRRPTLNMFILEIIGTLRGGTKLGVKNVCGNWVRVGGALADLSGLSELGPGV